MNRVFKEHRILIALLILIVFQSCRTPEPVVEPEPDPEIAAVESVRDAVMQMVDEIYEEGWPVSLTSGVYVDRVEVDNEERRLDIHMNERFSYTALRPAATEHIYEMLEEHLPRAFRDFEVTLYSLEEPIENLIPNIYRRSVDDYDFLRMPYADEIRPRPVVQRHDRLTDADSGLKGRQIALWHSHGWYYNQQRERWEWQRPRLFQTVEDLLPMSFTIPYLIPMLENAGAYVWVPRERDLQSNESVVDFDSTTGGGQMAYLVNGDTAAVDSWNEGTPGFGIGSPPYKDGENPFRMGSYRYLESTREGESVIQWIPDIPESGEYAVYISYVSLPQSANDTHYSVYHRGGKTDVTVNQRIGGGTWVYLGHFEFEEGVHPDSGRVELANYSWRPSIITADAVRFGGGMGNIEREGQTGDRPRFLEAARYNLQYAGMPDSLVYRLSGGESDNVDDFRGRGEWVNYLRGAPYGPNEDRSVTGLGVPVDLSLAFHTDAGITRNDTVVGTLMIYSIEDIDSVRTFPDEISRLANRDFADIMQTEIVEDIRTTWDPAWNRRNLFNRMYSEAARPNVPSALLELLSHQNFIDMQYAMDPRFRFDMSRTIYKSMLRFLADRYQFDYVVQPLPVSNFRVLPHGGRNLLLRWDPVTDSLEATADPDRFIVYKKRGEEPFDTGRITDEPEYLFEDLDPDVMYRFKVVAANEGGKSFPSEILAATVPESFRRPVLIVNGFERISGPATVDEPGFKGFVNFQDRGVPDRYDIHFTGDQYNYDPDSEWRTNDDPGHGASHADFETRIIPGNRFDFPAVYGASLLELEVPFVSASVASIRDRQVDMNDFEAVILIFGNQKTTPWPHHDRMDRDPAFQVFPGRLREEIDRYLALGGRLFISGSHVGTDVADRMDDDGGGMTFIRHRLGFANETNHAARLGEVRSVTDSLVSTGFRFSFNTGYHPQIYMADAPDAIVPYGDPYVPAGSSIDDGGAQRAWNPQMESNPESVANSEAAIPDGVSNPQVASPESIANSQADPSPYTDSLNRDFYNRAADLLTGYRKAITPSGPETLVRYEENQFSAGVGYRTDEYAVITFGFPFETIVDPDERIEVLTGIFQYIGIPTGNRDGSEPARANQPDDN